MVDEAEELPVELPVDVEVAVEAVEAPAPEELAFWLPQTKDWQKVWPERSLGCAVVHWPTQASHSRDGRVSP